MIVKPRFVAESATFALDHGWQPDARVPQFNIKWRDGTFYVARNPAFEVRQEIPSEFSSIRKVNDAAFETSAEATLVDALREAGVDPFISLIASTEGTVVGHILFTPAQVVGDTSREVGALGPMAVLPEFQRRGVGSQLVHAGLEACRSRGWEAVVVLGHPEFYPRFGFKPMHEFGLTCEFEAPPEVLMALELQPGALGGHNGEVRYHPLFKTV